MHGRAEETHGDDQQQRDDEDDPGQTAWLFHGIDDPLDESPSLHVSVLDGCRGSLNEGSHPVAAATTRAADVSRYGAGKPRNRRTAATSNGQSSSRPSRVSRSTGRRVP